jgi:hypothetical protein
MKNSAKGQRISGYFMAFSGFILIFINALNYIFHWQQKIVSPAIGILFLVIGIAYIRKAKKLEQNIFPNE